MDIHDNYCSTIIFDPSKSESLYLHDINICKNKIRQNMWIIAYEYLENSKFEGNIIENSNSNQCLQISSNFTKNVFIRNNIINMSENKNIGSIFRIQTHNCNNVQICNNVISSYGDISPNIAFDVMRGGYESLFLNNTYHNKENNSTIFLPDGINSKLNISYLQHYIPKNSYVLDNTDVEKTILIDSGETPIYTVRLLGEATTNGSIDFLINAAIASLNLLLPVYPRPKTNNCLGPSSTYCKS